MGVEIRQLPHRDTGTNSAKQIEEPVTVTADTGQTPTGAVEQQAAEVTVTSTEHVDGPTGAVEQSGPTTVVADWPQPEKPKSTAKSSSKRKRE